MRGERATKKGFLHGLSVFHTVPSQTRRKGNRAGSSAPLSELRGFVSRFSVQFHDLPSAMRPSDTVFPWCHAPRLVLSQETPPRSPSAPHILESIGQTNSTDKPKHPAETCVSLSCRSIHGESTVRLSQSFNP